MSVRARGLHVRLGAFALGPVDLQVPASAVTALIGPNGGGKTTLLRAMCGLVEPSGGTVEVEGDDVSSLAAVQRARRIAFVPQRPAVPAGLSVREVVELGRLRLGAGGAAVDGAMAAVGIEGLASRPMHALSAGQVHRVAVARALCQCVDSTRLLALDEPTSTLDPAWSRELARVLREVAARGVSVIVATHDLAFAGACCDHAVLLAHGQVEAAGAWSTTATAASLGSLFGTPFADAHGLADRPIALPRW